MPTPVTEIPCAPSNLAEEHFAAEFTFETDCQDVFRSQKQGADFVLLDVRGPDLYAKGHVPGAVNLPYGKIITSKVAHWSADTVFVVYCAGPHCNGATHAALRLARLGRPVKIMAGGITGWLDEGLELQTAGDE
jgi:rhodanese-related sulfurtransferase